MKTAQNINQSASSLTKCDRKALQAYCSFCEKSSLLLSHFIRLVFKRYWKTFVETFIHENSLPSCVISYTIISGA